MILYYDCFSGISGDMNLAAMIDIGVPQDYLKSELSKLNLTGYSIDVSEGIRNSISGTQVKVNLDQGPEHHHRNLKIITETIEKSGLNTWVKEKSLEMFNKLAEAESRIHDMNIDEIHFHEVGAVDSIVDIVGAAICFDYLKPEKIYCSAVELGSGMVKCAHGIFPVPAPATAEILKGVPVKTGTQSFEATTPTGAVILASNVDEFVENSKLIINKTAYGIGHKESDVPNVLRVFSGDNYESTEVETKHRIIECNIDDMNPEVLTYVMGNLLEAGADDVFITPIIMKKSRNASKLSILCKESLNEIISDILIRETSTLGFRSYAVEKTELEREFTELKTKFGTVKIKLGYYKGKLIKQKAEYEDIVIMAKKHNIPIMEVYREVERLMND